MSSKLVVIRKHAILKQHYRRAVEATPRFHELDANKQWAVLRKHVEEDRSAVAATLLKIMDNSHERDDEVLSELKAASRFNAPGSEMW
jgi:hypothetical protein